MGIAVHTGIQALRRTAFVAHLRSQTEALRRGGRRLVRSTAAQGAALPGGKRVVSANQLQGPSSFLFSTCAVVMHARSKVFLLIAACCAAGSVSGDLAFGAFFPASHSLKAIGASSQTALCSRRRVQSSVDTKCSLGANFKDLFKGSSDVRSDYPVHVVEKERTADDLIIDILCDAGDVAGFVAAGIWKRAKQQNVMSSFAMFSKDTLPSVPVAVAETTPVAVAEANSVINGLWGRVQEQSVPTFAIFSKDEVLAAPVPVAEAAPVPVAEVESAMIAPPSRWEEALVQQLENGESHPSASPWKIVAPGCLQVPGDQSDSQTLQRARLMELRNAFEKHGTISLVENGSRYLGVQHAHAKQAARPVEPETLPGRLGSFQEMSASVLSEVRSKLPGMPAGRMGWLGGMATALSARAKGGGRK